MGVIDDAQHLAVEAAGAVVMLVGVYVVVATGLPILGTELHPIWGVVFLVIGLSMMGYLKLARAITRSVDRLTG